MIFDDTFLNKLIDIWFSLVCYYVVLHLKILFFFLANRVKFGANGCLARISICGQLNNCSVMSCYVKISEINPKKTKAFFKMYKTKVSLTPCYFKNERSHNNEALHSYNLLYS